MQLTADSRVLFGRYAASILTPRPDALEQFVPLWDKRRAVSEERAVIELQMEALAKKVGAEKHSRILRLLPFLRGIPSRASKLHGEAYAEWLHVSARIARLTKEMAPLQFVRFQESFPNLVTTVGKNDILDKYLKGATYTQTLVMGLCGAGTKAAGDTQASHAGWSEVGGTNAPAYTGNRPAITMGSASAGVSTSPSQAYAITSSGTVAGCFMNNGGSATKDDTTGVLFSAGDFSGGSQAVANLDTLNVVWSLTAT